MNWLMQRILEFRYRGAPPADWEPYLAELTFVETLSTEQRTRLVMLARMFESSVRFDGRHGMEVDERVRRLITLQACRLILGLGYESYRYVHRVTVAEGTFILETREGTMKVRGAAESGGHIAVSWQEAVAGLRRDDDGRNVIYHEFAHVLDGYDGVVDGRPDIGGTDARATWKDAVGGSYRRLRRSKRRRQLIDKYGATSPVEFFAEATEVFFERPTVMQSKDPVLYDALADYFRQNPAASDDVSRG